MTLLLHVPFDDSPAERGLYFPLPIHRDRVTERSPEDVMVTSSEAGQSPQPGQRSGAGHAEVRTGGQAEGGLNPAQIELLRRSWLFAGLTDAEMAFLARRAQCHHYATGQVLFLEGDRCRGLYVVEVGTVRLFTHVNGDGAGLEFGREQTVGLMGPGATFAEVPVTDGGPNPVSAVALQESRVVLLPRTAVHDLLRGNPAFAVAALTAMAGRTRHLLAMVQDLSLRQVHGRVAKILLQAEAPSAGVGAGAGRQVHLTQQQVAEMAGTVREVVARTLRDFEREGAIAVDRGQITILDRAKLAAHR